MTLCCICQCAPCGLGWTLPPAREGFGRSQYPSERHHSRKHFCSMDCMTIFTEQQHGDFTMDPLKQKNQHALEQHAAHAVLRPLGDYVAIIGSDKALAQYSKAEIHGLIQVVLDSYHTELKALHKNEIPF